MKAFEILSKALEDIYDYYLWKLEFKLGRRQYESVEAREAGLDAVSRLIDKAIKGEE